MKPADQELAPRMRALAETHPRGQELRDCADTLERHAAGFFAEPQTIPVHRMIGAWARARRLWCACTGEPLI